MYNEQGDEDIIEEKKYNISIRENNTKTNLKQGTKFIIGIIISTIIGVIISQLIIRHQYGAVIVNYKEQVLNNEMVISDYTKIVRDIEPSLVSVAKSEEVFSEKDMQSKAITGVIIDSAGSILTNYSIVEGLEEVFVRLNTANFTVLRGKVALANKANDVAIIKVEYDKELVPIKIAESNAIYLGEEIVILGNSVYKEGISSITTGIVSSKPIEVVVDGNKFSLIQTNAPINGGNTGGPICNSKGELIGLASLKYTQEKSESGLYQGIELKQLKGIISTESVFKRILGIEAGGILTNKERGFKGYYVEQVSKGGNAYLAGIKPTDIILEIENDQVRDIESVIALIKNKSVGDILKCSVLSDGEIKKIDIKIVK